MNKINDCNKIISALTNYEKSQVDEITNENIEFLNVIYYKNLPVGFIVAKNMEGTDDYIPSIKSVYVIIAVDRNFRNRNIATNLVNDLLNWFNFSDFDEILWTCNIYNKKSRNLAIKNGFTYAWDKDENTKVYRKGKN